MNKGRVNHRGCFSKVTTMLIATMFILTLVPMIASTKVEVGDYYALNEIEFLVDSPASEKLVMQIGAEFVQ
jgi:hypothetical protein